MSLSEIEDETRYSGDKDGEARDGDGRLGRELEHSHYDWDGNAASPDASDVAEYLDQGKDDKPSNLQREHREHALVCTVALFFKPTNVPRMVRAILVNDA